MYTVNHRYEWDDEKAKRNAIKHGVHFKTAAAVFDDPHAFIMDDPEHSIDESRYWIIGEVDFRIFVIVFTMRSEDRIRMISARRATRRERISYEENKGI